MSNFRILNRKLHPWGAIAIALPFLVIIASGVLLQLKKLRTVQLLGTLIEKASGGSREDEVTLMQRRFDEAASWSERRLELMADIDDPDHLCEGYEAAVPVVSLNDPLFNRSEAPAFSLALSIGTVTLRPPSRPTVSDEIVTAACPPVSLRRMDNR